MGAYKYKLSAPLIHFSSVDAPPFRNAWLWVRPTGNFGYYVEVLAGYAWDGATCAPELPGTKWASCIHDAIYQFSEQIAEASGWNVRRVLRWGDEVFLERMLDDQAPRIVAYIYYVAVRLAGHAFHILARAVRGPADERTRRRKP